ncbi:hypothetical protein V6N12_024236 [Hibiscus sabdariffa]|uniref:NAC domain-containing protein n=1 Tax=Hibiscus sabdariffa TaxID=183260 RepID=A0ABR2G002_9ROSI
MWRNEKNDDSIDDGGNHFWRLQNLGRNDVYQSMADYNWKKSELPSHSDLRFETEMKTIVYKTKPKKKIIDAIEMTREATDDNDRN